MKLGIMQPYFLPYIGCWQLLNAVDQYVVYDDVNFIKGGWINRNRLLQNGSPAYFNVPMVGASSFKKINEISINRTPQVLGKPLKTIEQNYRKAPMFEGVFPLMEEIFRFETESLSEFLFHSIVSVCAFLGIHTEIILSSELAKNNDLKGQDKVLEICRLLRATEYFNAIGGQALYSKSDFVRAGVTLRFVRTEAIEYSQMQPVFVPNLSILDVMMFNTPATIASFLQRYTLV